MMSDAGEVIAEKFANALIRDAEPAGSAILLWLIKPMIAKLRAFYGGFWVGGKVYLTSSSIEFKPNALNRRLHKGDANHKVSLDDVVKVEDRFGLVTRIVDITCRNEEGLTFRCYGARGFADKIRHEIAHLGEVHDTAKLQ